MCYPNFFFSYHHSNHLLHHHHGQQDMFIFTTLLLSRTTTLFGMTILPAVPESKQRYAAFIISMSTLHAIQALFSLRTCFEQIEKTFLFLKLFLCKKWFGKESNINNNEGNISTWNTQTLAFTSNIKSDTICFVYGCVVQYKNLKLLKGDISCCFVWKRRKNIFWNWGSFFWENTKSFLNRKFPFCNPSEFVEKKKFMLLKWFFSRCRKLWLNNYIKCEENRGLIF